MSSEVSRPTFAGWNRPYGHEARYGPEGTALEVAACRKVLDEERSSLEVLEKEHAAAEASVRKLKQEYDALSSSQSSAGSTAAGLKERLREQKAVVKQIESDVKALEKAYRSAAPGSPKIEAAKDLNASRKALEEEKAILSELQREYDRTKGGAKRLRCSFEKCRMRWPACGSVVSRTPRNTGKWQRKQRTCRTRFRI